MAENGSRATQTTPPLIYTPFRNATPPPPPRPPTLSSCRSLGGGIPRVHRPRLPIMVPPPPTTITLQPLGSSLVNTRRPIIAQTPLPPASTSPTSPASPTSPVEVSLAAPRPNNDRTVNEYVETPFRPPDVVSKGKSVDRTRSIIVVPVRRNSPHHQTIHLPIIQHHNNNKGGRSVQVQQSGQHNKRQLGQVSTVVTKQPGVTATFKKDLPVTSSSSLGVRTDVTVTGTGTGTSADCFRGSIICPECGRCRCESCRQPRPLPSRWLCHDTCFCSPETAVDYVTCVCCVKGVFYHCSKDYEMDRDGDGTCADDPCSCGSHRIYTRWACLSMLALALPCLLCYWPLRGCVTICEKCYARYANQGCRCEPRDPKITDLTPEKRLLDTSPDF